MCVFLGTYNLITLEIFLSDQEEDGKGCRQLRVCLASPHFILASCGGGIRGWLCWPRHAENGERRQLRGRYFATRPADPFSSIAHFFKWVSLSSIPFHLLLKLVRLHGRFTVISWHALLSSSVKKSRIVDCMGKSTSCDVENEAACRVFFGAGKHTSAEISAGNNSTQTS